MSNGVKVSHFFQWKKWNKNVIQYQQKLQKFKYMYQTVNTPYTKLSILREWPWPFLDNIYLL